MVDLAKIFLASSSITMQNSVIFLFYCVRAYRRSQKFWRRWGPWHRGVADPIETRHSAICVSISNFVARSKTIWAFLFLGRWSPAFSGWGSLSHRNMLLLRLCYRTKYGHSVSNHTRIIMEILQKSWTLHVPPFEGHWNRNGSIGYSRLHIRDP